MAAFYLAQVNLARPLEPLDSQLLREFVDALDSVNAVADSAHGFVWRLQTEEGNATSVRVLDDDSLIVNMSVWESIEALRAFVYTMPAHLAVMKRRREWFERMIPVDRFPHLHEHGLQHLDDGPHRAVSAFEFALDLLLASLEKLRETASA